MRSILHAVLFLTEFDSLLPGRGPCRLPKPSKPLAARNALHGGYSSLPGEGRFPQEQALLEEQSVSAVAKAVARGSGSCG